MQDFNLARRSMIDSQLRPEGVTDRSVLLAMGSVERERFVPEAARALAYFDRPLRLSEDRSMMPPAALGRLLSELAPRPGERALVVGSGTGYSAALLTEMGLEVVALEAEKALAAVATSAGVNTMIGELSGGWPRGGPYDIILIDGAVADIPEALAAQLTPGGRLAGAVADRGVTRLVIGRASGRTLGLRTIVDADVGSLPGFERPRAFTF
jgi:protein-L-isoaspartate(D-aspartate) O-methyltransferase